MASETSERLEVEEVHKMLDAVCKTSCGAERKPAVLVV